MSTRERQLPAVGSGTEEAQHLRENAAELATTPGVHKTASSFHRVPEWFCRSDQVFRRSDVNTEQGTDLAYDLTTRLRGQII